MTKKTRIRVARIAACAVIAAGASLTAAGAAQATGIDVGLGISEDGINADVGLGMTRIVSPCGIEVGRPATTLDGPCQLTDAGVG